VAEVTMSLEEYLELAGGIMKKEGSSRNVTEKIAKRVGKKDPKMARALRKANQIGRKKNGGYKKGYSQARIMKKAHQLRRKM